MRKLNFVLGSIVSEIDFWQIPFNVKRLPAPRGGVTKPVDRR